MESESGTKFLHRYAWEGDLLSSKKEPLEAIITIEQFLAYGVRDPKTKDSEQAFERAVAAFAPSIVDEGLLNVIIGPNEEIDLILRCRNTIAFVECVSGKNRPKAKLNQIIGTTERHRFGTYTKRILLTTTKLDANNESYARVGGYTWSTSRDTSQH